MGNKCNCLRRSKKKPNASQEEKKIEEHGQDPNEDRNLYTDPLFFQNLDDPNRKNESLLGLEGLKSSIIENKSRIKYVDEENKNLNNELHSNKSHKSKKNDTDSKENISQNDVSMVFPISYANENKEKADEIKRKPEAISESDGGKCSRINDLNKNSIIIDGFSKSRRIKQGDEIVIEFENKAGKDELTDNKSLSPASRESKKFTGAILTPSTERIEKNKSVIEMSTRNQKQHENLEVTNDLGKNDNNFIERQATPNRKRDEANFETLKKNSTVFSEQRDLKPFSDDYEGDKEGDKEEDAFQKKKKITAENEIIDKIIFESSNNKFEEQSDPFLNTSSIFTSLIKKNQSKISGAPGEPRETPLLDRKTIRDQVKILFYKDELNAHVNNIPISKTRTCMEIVSYLTKITADPLEQIVLIYLWITNNISYNERLYTHNDRGDNTPQGVLNSRKAVCEAYSKLFKEMLALIDIQCEYVGGHSRDSDSSFGPEYLQEIKGSPGHAWSCFLYNDMWHLADVTWGAGSLDKQKKFRKKPSYFYLCTLPEIFIRSHFPNQSEVQLLEDSLTWSLEKFSKSICFSKIYYESGLELKHVDEGSISCRSESMKFVFSAKKIDTNGQFLVNVTYGKHEKLNQSFCFYKGEYSNEWIVEVSFPQGGWYEVKFYYREDKKEIFNEKERDVDDYEADENEEAGNKKEEYFSFLFKLHVNNTDKSRRKKYGFPYTGYFMKNFEPFSSGDIAHFHKFTLAEGPLRLKFRNAGSQEYFIKIKNLLLNKGESYDKYYKQRRIDYKTTELFCDFHEKGEYDLEIYSVDHSSEKKDPNSQSGTLILKYRIDYLNESNRREYGFQNSRILKEAGYECTENDFYRFQTEKKTIYLGLKPLESHKAKSTYELYNPNTIFLKIYKLIKNTLYEQNENLHKILCFPDRSVKIAVDLPEGCSYQIEAYAKNISFDGEISKTGYKFLEYIVECLNYSERSEYGYQSTSYLYSMGVNVIQNDVYYKKIKENIFETVFSFEGLHSKRVDKLVDSEEVLYFDLKNPESYYVSLKDSKNSSKDNDNNNHFKIIVEKDNQIRVVCDLSRNIVYQVCIYFRGRKKDETFTSTIYKFLEFKIDVFNLNKRQVIGFQDQSVLSKLNFEILEGDFFNKITSEGRSRTVLRYLGTRKEFEGKEYCALDVNSYFFKITDKIKNENLNTKHMAKTYVEGEKVIFIIDLNSNSTYDVKVFYRAIGKNRIFEKTGKQILDYEINLEGKGKRDQYGVQNIEHLNTLGLDVIQGDFYFKTINKTSLNIVLRNKPNFNKKAPDETQTEFQTLNIDSYWIKLVNRKTNKELSTDNILEKCVDDKDQVFLTVRFPLPGQYEITVSISPVKQNGKLSNSLYPLLRYEINYA